MTKPGPLKFLKKPTSRVGKLFAVNGPIVVLLGLAVTIAAWLFPVGESSSSGEKPGGTTTSEQTSEHTTTQTTTQSTTTTTTAPPCGSPVAAEGVSAAFLEPCQETRIDGPYPTVRVAIPRYPDDGRLVIVTHMLTTENGMPHNEPPTYGQTTVDARTADPAKSGPGVWGQTLFVGQDGVCTKAGRAEVDLYLLTPAGAQEARGWQPGVALTIPAGSVKLDSVVITRADSNC
jgi:hypothetical protein